MPLRLLVFSEVGKENNRKSEMEVSPITQTKWSELFIKIQAQGRESKVETTLLFSSNFEVGVGNKLPFPYLYFRKKYNTIIT